MACWLKASQPNAAGFFSCRQAATVAQQATSSSSSSRQAAVQPQCSSHSISAPSPLNPASQPANQHSSPPPLPLPHPPTPFSCTLPLPPLHSPACVPPQVSAPAWPVPPPAASSSPRTSGPCCPHSSHSAHRPAGQRGGGDMMEVMGYRWILLPLGGGVISCDMHVEGGAARMRVRGANTHCRGAEEYINPACVKPVSLLESVATTRLYAPSCHNHCCPQSHPLSHPRATPTRMRLRSAMIAFSFALRACCIFCFNSYSFRCRGFMPA